MKKITIIGILIGLMVTIVYALPYLTQDQVDNLDMDTLNLNINVDGYYKMGDRAIMVGDYEGLIRINQESFEKVTNEDAVLTSLPLQLFQDCKVVRTVPECIEWMKINLDIKFKTKEEPAYRESLKRFQTPENVVRESLS